jgi:hypothetical protein
MSPLCFGESARGWTDEPFFFKFLNALMGMCLLDVGTWHVVQGHFVHAWYPCLVCVRFRGWNIKLTYGKISGRIAGDHHLRLFSSTSKIMKYSCESKFWALNSRHTAERYRWNLK